MLIETCRGFNPPIVEGGLQSLVVVVGVSGESRRSALCAEVCIGRLVLLAREPYRAQLVLRVPDSLRSHLGGAAIRSA